jgi:hypothetical protein
VKLPANDQTLILPDFDPRQLVKVVAAGVLSAGSAYLSSFRNPPPINSDVLTADEVADLLRLDRKTVYVVLPETGSHPGWTRGADLRNSEGRWLARYAGRR